MKHRGMDSIGSVMMCIINQQRSWIGFVAHLLSCGYPGKSHALQDEQALVHLAVHLHYQHGLPDGPQND